MGKNLTNSYRDRKSILNNYYLLQKIEYHFNFEQFFYYGCLIEGSLLMTKRRVSGLLDTHKDIVDRYIAIHIEELKQSGYEVLTGKTLNKFREKCSREVMFHDLNVYGYDKRNSLIAELEIFTFKAWLNMAMLLPEGEKTRFVRSRVLNIVIDIAAEKEGCRVKHIDRQIQYELLEVYREYNACTQEFKNATQQYLKLDRTSTLYPYGKPRISQYDRFALYYDNIYQLVFGNIYGSVKQTLILHWDSKKKNWTKPDRERSFSCIPTGSKLLKAIYHEIYRAMNSIEQGIAKKLEFISTTEDRKLEIKELNKIVSSLEQDAEFIPLIQEARTKLAIAKSLEANPKSYQDVINDRFKTHNEAIIMTNLDEFIQSKNQSLKEKLSMPDTLAVFQRLSDR